MPEKKIEPTLATIGQYLGDADKLVIPEYQRPYSWNIETCDKLLSDIVDYMDSVDDETGTAGDSYFFGSIIIDNDGGEQRLIDGQQRTTTFLLLLSALKLRLRDAYFNTSGDQESRQLHKAIERLFERIIVILYKAGDEQSEYLDNPDLFATGRFEYSNRSINENRNYTGDLEKIVRAKDFHSLENVVFRIPRRQLDNKFTRFYQNFKFFYSKFDEPGFRGPTFIKRFADTLLNKCQVIVIKTWDFAQAINMFNSLNSDGQPLTDSDIISARIYARSGGDSATNSQWEDLLASVDVIAQQFRFDITDILAQYMYIDRAQHDFSLLNVQGVRNFYTKRSSNPREYTNPELLEKPSAFISELQRLVDNWDRALAFPGVSALLRLSSNSRYFLASFMHREGFSLENPADKSDFTRLVRALMKLFILEDAFGIGYSTALIKGFLFEENKKLVNSSVAISEIENDFDNHISANFSAKEMFSRILSYRGYSLVYISNYLADPNAVVTGLGEIEIEHIMPQSGQHISVIRYDANLESDDDFEDYKNKIGNLLLLEKSLNCQLGNSWFQTKLTGYGKSALASAFQLATKEAGTVHPQWTRNEIDQRTNQLASEIVDFVFADSSGQSG
jgi:hypothetical protein